MTTKYRNIGGGHMDGSTLIKPGEVFECEDDDLCEKFLNKFEKVHPGEVADTPVTKAKDTTDETRVPVREDVTADFPSAGDNDLCVFKDKQGWWILDDGDPVNEKPLKKKAVDSAIEDYLEE